MPKALWNARDQQPAELRDFLRWHFDTQRFLTGPLTATPGSLQITMPCWTLRRSTDIADTLLPSLDLGIYVAEILAAQEEDRAPGFCPP